jgi:DNA-binding SARP family transcriptional activator
MEFRVLGPTELWSAGEQYDLGPARERSALAILLLTPRTIVPAETLIDRLWGNQPPPKARESLSVYMTRLRTSLREAVGDGVRLAGRASGYVLDLDPDSVDLHQFRRIRRQASALCASGDYDHAIHVLREADALWRGPALAGIRGDWVARMRDSLEEERRAAILERVECELELGRHADLVSDLHGLLAQYPLDETFIAHQMTAMYWSGRPGDALSLFRQSRDAMIEEQGAEPGAVLSELHQRILRRDPELNVRLASRRTDQTAVLDTLPPESAEFVGRDDELAMLTGEHGDSTRVCVIEGMPGVGKTTLAVKAARLVAGHYPDGAFYLNFHTHDPATPPLDSAEALHRLLTMLNVPAAQIPDAVGERAALWRTQLSRRRAVVILDDAARHDQIRAMLPTSGRSLILITTRRRLPDLDVGRVLTLGVLSLDDAVRLFSKTAGSASSGNGGEIEAAVGLCGRLPLAIQLAAGRLTNGGKTDLAELVTELSSSSARLGGHSPSSQQVMAAFELSYRSLEPDHQRFFRRLGVNPCPDVSLQAAAALGDGTLAEAEKALSALLDHHLLIRAPAGQFRFHDLIRGYAAARAADEDQPSEQRQAVARLLDYYLYAADKTDRVLHPFRYRVEVTVSYPPAVIPPLGTEEDAAAWLDLEWRNIVQAAQYAGQHEWKRRCADLTHVLAGFAEVKGYWDEAITANTLALQASRDLADQGRIARACLQLSVVNQHIGRGDFTMSLAEEAAGIYQAQGDERGLAESLDHIGQAHHRGGGAREALAYFDEARTLYERVGNTHGMANTLSHSAISSWHLGRYPDSLDSLQEALSLYRDMRDKRGEAKTLNNLGKMQLHSGYHRDALESFQDSLVIFGQIGGTQSQAVVYHNIGTVYQYKGSYEKGLAAYRRALAIYRELGDLPNEGQVLNAIGQIYQSAECFDEALIHYEKARLIAEEIGDITEQVVTLRGIADLQRGSGQYCAAFENYNTALRLSREIGDPYEEAKALEGIAEATLSTQKPFAARIIFRQALDIFERLGVPEAESARIRMETTEPVLGRRTSLSAAAR